MPRPHAGPGTRPPVAHPRRVALAALAALLLALAGPAVPAVAHDALIGTEPADGTVVDLPLDQVVLTFSADQMDVGAAVQVVDATGADRADGSPVVDGATVSQPVADLAPGPVEVRWRSVSSDGHALEGTFAFSVAATDGDALAESSPGGDDGDGTAGDGATTGTEGAAVEDATAEPTTGSADEPATGAAEAVGGADEATSAPAATAPPLAVVAGLVVATLAVLGTVATVLVRRRRHGAP